MMMNTPAMMNQYGETCTGMPNGLATTKLFCRGLRPRCSACSSWPVATSRCYVHSAANRVTARTGRGIGLGCEMSVGCPTVAFVDVESAVNAGAVTIDPGAEFGAAGDPPSALSPSRAGDFMTCPLLYRFRVIDRIPEPPTTATARGTLVHAVLERLFDLPAAGRTPDAAQDMLIPEWTRLCADDELLAALITD